MSTTGLLPLAISMGEPAGIGPDIILRLFADRAALDLPPFVVYGQAGFLKNRARRLGLGFDIVPTTPAFASTMFETALPIVEIDGLVPDKPGDSSPLSAKVVIEAINQAVAATLSGSCRGVVTAPIHKGALYTAGFKFPGHTEFIASLCAAGGVTPMPVMMLAHEGLRVVPATIHVPLHKVPGLITNELIVATGKIVAHDLRTRFGIAQPRLAVTGLNPHAGEGGSIGMEDLDIVAPAIANLRFESIDVDGPLPADTAFHLPKWRQYDAIIAMYHDQALIPIKTVAFDEAVNVTLGLPIVRTSPDHGTAFDLAGTGEGSTASFLAAIRLADRLTNGGQMQQVAAQ
ncbi:MAG: 4-hydroxythreonine-4-phosphate dehydrogenase PdxA [Hyphomicrobiales bacterium]|nr:MAG: 4-hydroxythreonine-4-phosphate dehydrogenase PdxA [Hyphomicrobiales bacterium]